MGKLWVALVVVALLAPATQAWGVYTPLTSSLQMEVNEVAMLTAQANYLQQQGDQLGAAVVASYIPDHRMMISRLSAAMQQMGGNPSTIVAKGTPFLGTRAQIIDNDLKAYAKAMDHYRDLSRRTSSPVIKQLAAMGRDGAWRHYDSLVVASGATLGTPEAIYASLLASQALEQAAISDLQAQAARLASLGDQTTANVLLGMAPSHQQQAANLQVTTTNFGTPQFGVANRGRITTIPPVAALDSRAQILAHFQVVNTQFINTYALAINGLPPSPLQRVMADGQTIALTSLTVLQRLPVA